MKKMVNFVNYAKSVNLIPEEFLYLWTKHTYNYTLEIDRAYMQSLRVKDLITDTDVLTIQGQRLVDDYLRMGRMNEQLQSSTDEEFREWWNTYPQTDAHLHYPPTRNLKVKRDACWQLYVRARQDYDHEELLEALKKDIHMRKIRSTDRNELTYLKNTINYLSDEDYLMYLNDYDQNISLDNAQTNNPRHKLL